MSPTATRARPQAEMSGASPELELRRRRHRRRLLAKLVSPLLALLLIIAGIWVLGFSRAFAVRVIQVHGISTVSRTQLLSAAQVPEGLPLARVDLNQITARVDAIPAVESSDVHRSWPSTIAITVRERRPVYAVEQQGSYLLVDKFGVGYRALSARPENTVLAQVGAPDPALLAEIATVVAVLPDSIRNQLRTVSAQSPDSITLRLTKGREVVWGDDSRSADKRQVLQALLEHPASRYDVSAPDQPAVRR